MNSDCTIESLLSTYGTDVLRFVRFYTKNARDAEDLMQEVFLRAYRSRNTFRNDCGPKTWLIQIAVNVCRNYKRGLARRPQVLMDTVPCAEQSPSAESEVVQKSEDAELLNLIYDLSPVLKEVILLYYYEEKSTGEIAQLLGVTAGTVKIRLHRARNALKRGKEHAQRAEQLKCPRMLKRIEANS